AADSAKGDDTEAEPIQKEQSEKDESKDGSKDGSKDEPRDEEKDEPKDEENDPEPEKDASETEKKVPQPSQPKGKKKNKKGRNKKAKDNSDAQEASQPKATDNAPSSDKPKAQDETESAQPVDAEADADTQAVPDAETNGASGKDTSIAALGDKMDDVSLSDNDDTAPKSTKVSTSAEPAEQKTADKPVEQNSIEDSTEQKPADASTEQVAAPQTAARETKTPSGSPENTQTDQPQQQPKSEPANGQDASNVRKRLCERWLDNLIMILFDDLRTYTNWRTKMHNLRATGQQVVYQFTQAEWEALGDLALRLHRPSEAREAYECALRIRFSAKAWLRLLELHTGKYAAAQAEEGKRNDSLAPPPPLASTDSLMMALDAAVWLAVYNDRWYNNMAYPNPLCNLIIKLVNIHGLSKVHNSLISMNLKPAVFSMVKRHLEIAEKFEVTGTKW
ncbi:bud site selection protein, partial [Coemansia erecta]